MTDGPTSEGPPVPSLRRTLSYWEVTASGVGIIVGAGIYVLVGEATAAAGATVWMSFVAAGVLSVLTALSYAELSSAFPRASAEFEFTRQAVKAPWVSFVVGWVMIAGLSVGAAAVSLGFASYVRIYFDIPAVPIALGLLAVVSSLALSGIENSARATVLLSLVQVGGLVLIIATGASHAGDVNLLEGPGPAGVLAGAALVFFAFLGFDEVITLSDETENPSRTIPLALFTALGISTVLYVLVAVVAVSVVGPDTLATSSTPLADVMAASLGGASDEVVAVIAMLATTNTTLLMVTAASRMIYGMAQVGALPRSLASVSRNSRVPWLGVLWAAAIAAGFTLSGDIGRVAGVTDSAVYFVFLSVNLTVIALRYRRPDIARPFRIPWNIGRVPVPAVLGLGATGLMMSQLERDSLAVGGVVMAVGLVVGYGFHLLDAGQARPQ